MRDVQCGQASLPSLRRVEIDVADVEGPGAKSQRFAYDNVELQQKRTVLFHSCLSGKFAMIIKISFFVAMHVAAFFALLPFMH